MQLGKISLLTISSYLIFLALAILGWHKLKYGFNFEDEGMYMVDGWRLTIGDRLFPDNAISATSLYVIFNALIFKLFPEISLLEFRQFQYVLAIFAIIIFGLAIYRCLRKSWPITLTLATFTFTGLDTSGSNSNLSYYTYPHLFLTLHITFLIFALTSQKGKTRFFSLIASGFSLWAIGFSLLPLSIVVISPILLWFCTNYFDLKEWKFSFMELLLILSPSVILWGGFIAIYNTEFFNAIFDIYSYAKESEQGSSWVNYVSLEYIGVIAVFCTLPILLNKLHGWGRYALVIVASSAMFIIVDSNIANLIQPYWYGWFSSQMWFCSVLILFMFFSLAYLVRKSKKKSLTSADGLILILLIPSVLIALLFSHYSSLGIIATMYVAIPVCMALTLFLIQQIERLYSVNQNIVAVTILAITFPFYYHIVWQDWRFTFSDLPPEMLQSRISSGFAEGIQTNSNFSSIIQWMEMTSSLYSKTGEFSIVMDQSPMVYMLISRRPSLNHSWTGWGRSLSLRKVALEGMLKENRQPKIAYRFVRLPWYWPISLKDGTYSFVENYIFPPNDPISEYVTNKMQLIDTFYIKERPWVEFYVQK
ncbi:MAG: hypothetical protein HOO95_03715 [Gallionella sp.]|nr:hypothetical protein [Gallionella sp.]